MESTRFGVVIGGSHETQEDKLRRQVTELMSYLYILKKRDLNAIKFKEAVLKEMGKEDANSFELMDAFSELDKAKKIEIVETCSNDLPNLDFNDETLLNSKFNLCDRPFDYVDNNQNGLTEEQIKKRLKYCKNPMERRNLERELNSLRFMEGKHRRGKKK